ncbi:hypothetical protein GQ54DRAFT_311887 [Martensiomyces pterosporus]|nr:hypothetical protein GQ54DRAFT_311887 [Martensiomyces pterosporus]
MSTGGAAKVELPASRLSALVTELTTTGRDTPDHAKLCELKRACRDGPPETTAAAFELLLRALSKEHAQIRISCLQVINELFVRSHQLRLLLIDELPQFLSLTLGIHQRPLPLPRGHARRLKQLATECVYAWVQKFGRAYQRLVLAFRYLKHCAKIDFTSAAAKYRRSDPERIQQAHEAREENRREYMVRSLVSVRADMALRQPEMDATLSVLHQCFSILVPSVDGLFDSEADAVSTEIPDACNRDGNMESDDDIDDVLAVMAANRYGVEVDLNPDGILDAEETSDNKAVYDAIRDNMRLVVRRNVPRAELWLAKLSHIDSSIDPDVKRLAEAAESLNRQMSDAQLKCRDLKLDLSILDNNGGSDDGSDGEFEDVPELARFRDRRRDALFDKRGYPAGSRKRNAVFALQDEEAMKDDPTYVKPRLVRKARPAAGKDAERRSATNSVEDKLRETAPVVDFGPDLLYWDQDVVDANTTGLEIRHRFLGSARDDAAISGEAVDSLKRRAVYYNAAQAHASGSSNSQESDRPCIRACRAPMKNGKLCTRRDLVACPYHGPVVPRDEQGRPQTADGQVQEIPDARADVSENASTEVQNAASSAQPSTVATAESVGDLDWRDLESLVSQRHQLPQVQTRAQRKRKGSSESSALIDIRKQKTSSYSRLRRIIR